MGSLIYSPVLDDDQSMDKIHKFLDDENLSPVQYIVCPTPQHHLCLREYREAFPNAFMICAETRGGVMPPLHKRRRDLDFNCILHPAEADTEEHILWALPTVKCRIQYGERSEETMNTIS